jgi:hypothetical protein
MFMRFLGIGIGHCNQHPAEAGPAAGIDGGGLEFMNDNGNGGDMGADNAEDVGGGMQDSDDEEGLEGGDLDGDDSDEEYYDIGYDDL